MDIPGLSMNLSQINLQSQVGVAVLSKAMDSAENSGDAMVDMMSRSMELSVNPSVGANFDMSV
jgi:hypothetical protein